jgi:hypothetical protein
MNLLMIQKEGVDLHRTLLESETSREILRFYRPKKTEFGVIIENSTLGGSLSLISELNWYIRRYVADVFLEISPELYCTRDFATDVYQRSNKLKETWAFSKLISIKDGSITDKIWIEPHSSKEDYPEIMDSADYVLEVWCAEYEKE